MRLAQNIEDLPTSPDLKGGRPRGSDYTGKRRREAKLLAGWRNLYACWPPHGPPPYVIRARVVTLEDHQESHDN